MVDVIVVAIYDERWRGWRQVEGPPEEEWMVLHFLVPRAPSAILFLFLVSALLNASIWNNTLLHTSLSL